MANTPSSLGRRKPIKNAGRRPAIQRVLINEDIPVYLMSKNGIYFIYASLAGLARNPEFSLASRKTSKVQEIAHYNPEPDLFFYYVL